MQARLGDGHCPLEGHRKPEVGWHFAPSCCVAQSVRRARRRSAVLRSMPVRFCNAVEALRLLESAQPSECAAHVQYLELNRSLGNRHVNQFAPAKPPSGHSETTYCASTSKWLALCEYCKSSCHRPPNSLLSPISVLANPSLNRTHCGVRQKARHFILGLLPHTATGRLAQTLAITFSTP